MIKRLQGYSTYLTQFASTRFSVCTWWPLALITYVIARLLQLWLDASYLDSQFPVPFYIGQTTFNADELKGYFQVLIDKGTLGIFLRTQVIDFAFMLGTFASFFCLTSALLRSIKALQQPQWLIRIGLFFVWFSPLAAVMDAIENFISFIMLSEPLHFANWLVHPYSSFAVLKFAIFAATYLWLLVALISIAGVSVYRGIIHRQPIFKGNSHDA